VKDDVVIPRRSARPRSEHVGVEAANLPTASRRVGGRDRALSPALAEPEREAEAAVAGPLGPARAVGVAAERTPREVLWE
jgi:hypothetical protein